MAPLSTAWLIFTLLSFHMQYSQETSSSQQRGKKKQKNMRIKCACSCLCVLFFTHALESQKTTNQQTNEWQTHQKRLEMDVGNKGRCIKGCECCLEGQEISVLTHSRRDTECWSLTVCPSLFSFFPGRLITGTHNVSNAQDANFTE